MKQSFTKPILSTRNSAEIEHKTNANNLNEIVMNFSDFYHSNEQNSDENTQMQIAQLSEENVCLRHEMHKMRLENERLKQLLFAKNINYSIQSNTTPTSISSISAESPITPNTPITPCDVIDFNHKKSFPNLFRQCSVQTPLQKPR